jgi:hypothetical protein
MKYFCVKQVALGITYSTDFPRNVSIYMARIERILINIYTVQLHISVHNFN